MFPCTPLVYYLGALCSFFINILFFTDQKKKKSSLNEDNFYEIDEANSDEIEEVEMTDFERRQMKHAMRESHRFFEEGRHEHERGG